MAVIPAKVPSAAGGSRNRAIEVAVAGDEEAVRVETKAQVHEGQKRGFECAAESRGSKTADSGCVEIEIRAEWREIIGIRLDADPEKVTDVRGVAGKQSRNLIARRNRFHLYAYGGKNAGEERCRIRAVGRHLLMP